MKTTLLSIGLAFVLLACSSSQNSGTASKQTGKALNADGSVTDDYGYSENNPIKAGGGVPGEHKYLRSLTGPNGESIAYERLGSCCMFKTNNSEWGSGMLDRYEVEIDGDTVKKILYLNMYDKEKVYAPKGFVMDKK
jgi:hypothetical protein